LALAWVLSLLMAAWLGWMVRTGLATRRLRPKEIAADRAMILSQQRTALQLHPTDAAVVTQLGGLPWLPEALDWPVGREGPLAFLAQIDLAEARAAGGPDWLPSVGVAFVFNDECRYGLTDPMKLLFAPSPGNAAREPPVVLAKEHCFRRIGMQFSPRPSFPSLDWLNASSCAIGYVDDLYPVVEPDHHLGGYPSEIQPGSLALECEELAKLQPAGPHASNDEPANPLKTAWRLFLQIDSDSAAGMLWHDTGRLYLFIHEDDARTGNFSRTISVMQSY
jgi:hypothetical protein